MRELIDCPHTKCVSGVYDGVLVSVVAGCVTAAWVDRVWNFSRDYSLQATLTVIEETAPPPSSEARSRLSELWSPAADQGLPMVVVLEGNSIQSAMARSVLTGVVMLRGTLTGRRSVVSSRNPDVACEDLSAHLGRTAQKAVLLGAISDLRFRRGQLVSTADLPNPPTRP